MEPMNSEMDHIEKTKLIAVSEGNQLKFDEHEIELEFSKLQTDKSGLAIKILSIAGGFLATLAFLGFLFIAGLYDSQAGLILVGVFSISAAVWLNIAFNKLIIDTLSVTTYLIGFCLLAMGFDGLNFSENLISILFIVISFVVLIITRNYILSFVSILVICGSILFLIINTESYAMIHLYNVFVLLLLTYVFLNEAKIITGYRSLSRLYNPVRSGLLISVLIGLICVGKKGLFGFNLDNLWTTSIISIPLTLYVISVVIKVIGITAKRTRLFIYTLSILMLLPTVFSPAISGSLLIILLSFHVNYRFGLVTGIMSFIYFVIQYYYDLSFTLLTKSILLFSSGIVFLIFYYLTYKYTGSNEKV
jgi:hypothetical protein